MSPASQQTSGHAGPSAAPTNNGNQNQNQNKTPNQTAGNSLENFKVAVRLRPFTERERQRQSKRIVEIEQNTVALYNPKWPDDSVKRFTFDHSYWSHDGFKRNHEGVNVPDPAHPNEAKYVGQEQVFQDLGRFLLENALEGYNSALLAYGQTGSGKSYTVSGYGQNEGILPRFARELFAELDKRQLSAAKTSSEPQPDTDKSELATGSGGRYEVYFSMIEIYNEVVRDLLAKDNGFDSQKPSSIVRRGLRVREHPKRGFFVESLSSFQCSSKEEIESLIEEGQLNKSIAATSMNETSSRGHTIYEFLIRKFRPRDGSGEPVGGSALSSPPHSPAPAPTPTRGGGSRAVKKTSDPVETLTSSVVQLVDLAGSERMTVHLTGGGELGGSAGDPSLVRPASRSGSPYPNSLDQSGSSTALQTGQRQARSSTRSVRGSIAATRRNPAQAPTSASSSSSTTTNSQSTTASLRKQVQPSQPTAAGQVGSSRQSSGLLLGPNMSSHNHQRFKESVSINQSLSALGNCIQVLSQFSQQQPSDSCAIKQPKIPYRDSVLTKLLNRCCLSGNSKVVLIATLSPADANYDDTLSTLRFADRAKQIRTHAVINRSVEGVTALQRENERLKLILDGRVTRSDDSSQTSNFDDSENMQDNFNGPKSNGDSPKQQQRQSKSERASTVTRTRGAAATKLAIDASGKQATGGGGGKKQPKNNLRLAQENLLSSKLNAANNKALPEARARGAHERRQTIAAPSGGGLVTSVSSPTLAVANGQDQMEQLVSSAKKKMRQKGHRFATSDSVEEEDEEDFGNEDEAGPMRKSKSVGQNLAEANDQNSAFQFNSELLDEIDLNELANIIDDENLLSPDSDDSFNGHGSRTKFDENMSKQEKANILNRLLSNSNVANKLIRKQIESSINQAGGKTKLDRPKKAGAKQHLRPVKRGELANSARGMKKANPYLSNLNPDEQLTSMITYIVEPGETIVGKDDSCDLLIYGPGLRGRHAKLTRVLHNKNQASGEVFVEPISSTDQNLDNSTGQTTVSKASQAKRVALLVNGEPVLSKLRLAHGDRLLFGSTNYFVFVDESGPKSQAAPLSLGSITYEMAHAEVMQKMMSDTENAMIKEIKDYTHRPGTGKKRASRDTDEGAASATSPEISVGHANLTGANPKLAEAGSKMEQRDARGQLLDNIKEEEGRGNPDDPDELYRGKLMADTYEFAMPIAEANAVANEMGIKVTYGLKILTGEEQLEPLLGRDELQTLFSLEPDAGQQEVKKPDSPANVVVTSREPIKPNTLDIAPELYVHVRLDELQLDFYWTRDKFQERRVKMLELYGAWDVGGKSGLVEYLIEQSKYQGYYMIDPFVDDIRTSWALVGHAQVSLGPVSHAAGLRESYDVLDLDDEIVASLTIEAVPCQVEPVGEDEPDHLDWPYRALNGEGNKGGGTFLTNPRELLGKSFVFMLHVVSCSRVPPRFAQVFCQYTLNRDQPTIRTQLVATNDNDGHELAPNGSERQADTLPQDDRTMPIRFDHKHFLVIERVTEEILDFFQQGFLTIQLVGQYERVVPATASNQPNSATSQQSSQPARSSAGSSSGRSLAQPTLVSTIISSINKYRFRMEQQSAALQNFGAHFQNSDYANSVPYSANSATYRLASSSLMNSNSGPSSVTSASATSNLFDQQQDDDEGSNSLNGTNQENIIDMILTKRKLDRAENQLHFIKRTINIAEHHNKKHIPVRTVKKLLNSYGQELEGGTLEEMAAEVATETKISESKHSNCTVQ